MRRGRNRRKRTDHGIELVEWEEYFKELLGGIDWRVRRLEKRAEKGVEDKEGEISREEFGRVLKNCKKENQQEGMAL